MAIERKPESFSQMHHGATRVDLDDLRKIVGMLERLVDAKALDESDRHVKIDIDQFTCETFDDVASLHEHAGLDSADELLARLRFGSVSVHITKKYFSVRTSMPTPEGNQIAKDIFRMLESRALPDGAGKDGSPIDLRPKSSPPIPIAITGEVLGAPNKTDQPSKATAPSPPLSGWRRAYRRVGPVVSWIVASVFFLAALATIYGVFFRP